MGYERDNVVGIKLYRFQQYFTTTAPETKAMDPNIAR
jgi:hypothetical protein